jgi:hypothetical protein
VYSFWWKLVQEPGSGTWAAAATCTCSTTPVQERSDSCRLVRREWSWSTRSLASCNESGTSELLVDPLSEWRISHGAGQPSRCIEKLSQHQGIRLFIQRFVVVPTLGALFRGTTDKHLDAGWLPSPSSPASTGRPQVGSPYGSAGCMPMRTRLPD